MSRNFIDPPKDKTFQELFRYFWREGVGNVLTSNGHPQSWTDETLEHAFEDVGFSINARSFDNWRQGRAKADADNITALSLIAGGRSKVRTSLWRQAFVWGQEKQSQESKKNSRNGTKRHDYSEVKAAVQTFERLRPYFHWKSVVLLIAIVALCFAGLRTYQHLVRPMATNIRVCDIDHFDEPSKTCTRHIASYDYGITEFRLSFGFKNVAVGAPFERIWFRNGLKQGGMESFNSPPWEGWTFWRSTVPFEPGNYTVWVITGDTLVTQDFVILNKF